MFVRGNMLSVLNTNAHSVSNKGLQTGDTLRVGARKKGGWLRVRCSRTGEVISIRSGRHLCLASKAASPVSQIDLLIRENQLASAETTIQEVTKDLQNSNKDLVVAHQLLDEASKQNAELLDELVNYKQALETERRAHQEHALMLEQELKATQEKLAKSEAEFAKSLLLAGVRPCSVPSDEETTAAEALLVMKNEFSEC